MNIKFADQISFISQVFVHKLGKQSSTPYTFLIKFKNNIVICDPFIFDRLVFSHNIKYAIGFKTYKSAFYYRNAFIEKINNFNKPFCYLLCNQFDLINIYLDLSNCLKDALSLNKFPFPKYFINNVLDNKLYIQYPIHSFLINCRELRV